VYEDVAAGFSNIVITLTVPAGVNAAGDLVSIAPGGLTDTSGNEFDDDVPVTWELLDETAPMGLTVPADPAVAQIGSADNTNALVGGAGAVARELTLRYTATELLDDAAVLTVLLKDPDELAADIDITAQLDASVYDDTAESYTVLDITLLVPWNDSSWVGWTVVLQGLTDLAGNVLAAPDFEPALDAAWVLEDRTPPEASITGQAPGSADNSGGGVALTVAYTITAAEDCVDQDIDFRIFQSDGATQVIPPEANINLIGWSDPQTYEFEIDVPAGEDWTDYIIEFWNIEDLDGNAVMSDDPYVYTIQ